MLSDSQSEAVRRLDALSCSRYSRLQRGSPISYHGNMPGIKLERGQRLHPFVLPSLKAPSLAYTVLCDVMRMQLFFTFIFNFKFM